MPKQQPKLNGSAPSDVGEYRLANKVSTEARTGIVYLDFAQEDNNLRGRATVVARVAISAEHAARLGEELSSVPDARF
jgi:hypothetical protein